MSAYTYELRDATAYNPTLLPDFATLSAADNSFVINSFGTVNGRTVVAVLYNDIPAPISPLSANSTVLRTLSAATGTVMRAYERYNNQQFALEFNDGFTSEFTMMTAFSATKVQNLSALSDEHTGPNVRRLVTLGYR
jgi:hypothetical protein